MTEEKITPELLLNAYASGLFPMAESAQATGLGWYDPPRRGIIPLNETFHVPRRLKRTMAQEQFQVFLNRDFLAVMKACAQRKETWINAEILDLYTQLHSYGFAHSVECWQSDVLVGGLYGVSLRGAFFGESMFSKERDASKVALVSLVEHLRVRGFVLLDSQFKTAHLERFGCEEITRKDYHERLEQALKEDVSF